MRANKGLILEIYNLFLVTFCGNAQSNCLFPVFLKQVLHISTLFTLKEEETLLFICLISRWQYQSRLYSQHILSCFSELFKQIVKHILHSFSRNCAHFQVAYAPQLFRQFFTLFSSNQRPLNFFHPPNRRML